MNFKIGKNKSKTLSIFLVAVLVITELLLLMLNVQTFAQSGKTKIIIHYAKTPNSDLKWNMWLWTDKNDESKFEFNGKDEFGKVCVVEFDGALNKLGFIVRTDEWRKDTVDDRFIEKFNNGVGEVWLKGGDTKVYYSLAEASASNSKLAVVPPITIGKTGEFIAAKLDEMNSISIETNIAFPFTAKGNEGIIVKSDGQILTVKKVTSDEVITGITTVAKIELSENVNLGKKITVSKLGFPEKEVVLGDVMKSASFEKMFYYEGTDLGNTYSKGKTSFRVWAPTATEVKLVTYKKWNDKIGIESSMKKDEKGTWTFDLNGDQKDVFYTYKVNIEGVWTEAVDPYARSVSANGDKGAVIDLKGTDPEIWNPGEKPNFTNLNDAIIYELHVRDFSIDKNSGMENKGKFLAFTEKGTKGTDGKRTGVDYIKDLGVTHVELMPVFDYASVDETSSKAQYNWGYNPKNYNAPEGSYSTDPYNPSVRVKELKQAVQSLHDNGLRVNMDVVYNHMYSSNDSNFNKLVPGYYFRYDKDGTATNESGFGNTIASENAMARKFIVDSVMYWAKEYNLDGFRFDLMGLLDINTMTEIRKKLSSLDPSILIMGEGLDMGTTLLSDAKATQKNASKMPGISLFNDIIRDGIKGSVLDAKAKGFVNGKSYEETKIEKGIVGGIDYSNDIKTWGKISPLQSVNYVETHDNNTLWDKLLLTNPKDDNEIRLKMHKLADSIILTSQGIPFFQAGQEFLRTKGGNSNSYKSNDTVNKLDWTLKSKNIDTVNYFKGLIKLRKEHPAFKMNSAEMIKQNLKFLKSPQNVVAYEISHNANMDTWSDIVVAFNANREDVTIKLSKSCTWNIVVDGEKSGVKTIKQFKGDSLVVPALSSIVIYDGSENIFTTLPFWIYTVLILCGVTYLILFLKGRKESLE
ncbi:type I pullulanase [Clostridium tagluense]|uniref:type I pullulanase n=1 Tax=Clostridium tagluense TaxID=360422 RepID=UPI001CF26DC0|nr:type I pullulanase [Clostridium tagluense]MCB2309575.1 type I pullulanase [Clostridium tagluense]MCB2314895.1 type I pullulanase [Clostridium tagluense]MCB2319744.1 type I pullulanase [Clostridium tagluense]MCB2324169.1 type I pullulanase [Clostridium tagluense]MCB2329020.1 type I pullulanase [Clostridium tagluense]